jgi:hypothetical protein
MLRHYQLILIMSKHITMKNLCEIGIERSKVLPVMDQNIFCVFSQSQL